MGCDIHWVVEELQEDTGKWLGIAYSGFSNCPACNRWYLFFAELGMSQRGGSPTGETLNGVPDDASDLSKAKIAQWGADGHSHSWLPMGKFIEARRRANEQLTEGRENRVEDLFGGYVWPHDPTDPLRVVFWFDN